MLQESRRLDAFEHVSVALWRGYVTGCFYARPGDVDVAVVVSPSFRILRLPWQKRVPLDQNPDAVGALSELERTLIARGWQRIPGLPSSRWYQLWFGRPPRDSDLIALPAGAAEGIASRPGRPGDAGTDVAAHLAVPPAGGPSNGHPRNVVGREIVAALSHGPLASSELCRRIGRSPTLVRAARGELELAGLIRQASPPPGRSRRATYWELTHLRPAAEPTSR